MTTSCRICEKDLGANAMTCRECGTPYHRECWFERRCQTEGCSRSGRSPAAPATGSTPAPGPLRAVGDMEVPGAFLSAKLVWLCVILSAMAGVALWRFVARPDPADQDRGGRVRLRVKSPEEGR